MKKAGEPTARTLFARNCTVRRIDKDTAAAFLCRNHDFGDASSRYRYGLFCRRNTGRNESELASGTLVAVAEFSSARRMRDGSRSFEWIRYASERDLRVIGGMGKLLKAFADEVHPDDVMTYVDASNSDGAAYRKLGFDGEGSVKLPNGSVSLKFRKRYAVLEISARADSTCSYK